MFSSFKLFPLLLVTAFITSCGSEVALVAAALEVDSNGSDSASPSISVSGPSVIWSDDLYWSAKATVSGMDLSTVAYSISGTDDWIKIDPITGAIGPEWEAEPGDHRFQITATDGAGATAATTYSLRSDALIYGSWRSSDTLSGDDFRMEMTRSGQIYSNSYPGGAGRGQVRRICSGKVAVTGTIVDGKIDCRDNDYSADGGQVERRWSADIEGISEGSQGGMWAYLTINKVSVTSGEYTGMMVEEWTGEFDESYGYLFYEPVVRLLLEPGWTTYRWEKLSISPGLYVHASDALGFMELRVSADGSFNTVPVEEATLEPGIGGRDMTYSTCQVSGTITADPIHAGLDEDKDGYIGDTEDLLETVSSVPLNQDSIFSASNCSTDLDQSSVAAVAYSFVDSRRTVVNLVFGTPGNEVSNNGYRPVQFSAAKVCDDLDQPTSLGLNLGVSCPRT
jgi:hypothetical protein